MTSSDKILACPKCESSLTLSDANERLICLACNSHYPILNGLATFFEEPKQAIAIAYLNLYQSCIQLKKKADDIESNLKDSTRKRSLLRLLKAYRDNQAMFERWAKDIETSVSAQALLQAQTAQNRSIYGYGFDYLIRDWGDLDFAQNDRANISEGIKTSITYLNQHEQALVLGMGTGRWGLEIADSFEQVMAIDNSYGQIMHYHELLRTNLDFWQIETKNRLFSQDMVQKVHANIPNELKRNSDNVEYYWADATNCPFIANSFDCIFSIYFSDVIPLPKLVNEVKRLLKPGGNLVHYGPLHYHFENVEHHYSYDEFIAFFENQGFRVIHRSEGNSNPVAKDYLSLINPSSFNDRLLVLRLDK